MGSVELLSREGEIAIAKRIEAGREAMIAGLCESPLTFQAIIIWRDELNSAKILLRDVIDLEATYEGPEAKSAPPPIARADRGAAGRARSAGSRSRPSRRRRCRRRAAPRRRDRRRGRFRERHVAGGHGGRAQAQGARDLRQDRRRLQAAQEAAGQARRDARGERADLAPAAEGLREAARRGHQGREEPVAQQRPHRDAGRAALPHQPQPGAAGEPPDAARRQLRRAAPELHRRVLRQRAGPGLARPHGGPARQEPLGARSSATTAGTSRRSARRSARSPRRRGWRSPSSGASSRQCRRASARRARPRRRWWRPTCAS